MGLEVAETSELAAFRPIHTTAVTGARATAGGMAEDHDAAGDADTGCVTPTACSARIKAAGGGDDAGAAAADGIGCATPTASEPMTAAPQRDGGDTAGAADDGAAAVDGIGCATPTASEPMAAPQRAGGADDDDTGCYATPMARRPTAPLGGAAAAAAAAGDAACFTTPTSEDSALRPATVCPPAPRKLAPALKRKLAPLQQRLFYPVPLDLTTVFKPAPPPAAKKMRPAHVVESSLPLGT